MNINEAFPSNYLKASDLQGKEPTVTISNVTMEKLGDDARMILYFQGKQKGMVCNKTNATNIAAVYGDDTDNWLGCPITLYVAWVDFQGRSVQGLRVRPVAPNGQHRQQQVAQAAQAPADMPPPHPGNERGGTDVTLDDEIPF
jgi:hypothetical protein